MIPLPRSLVLLGSLCLFGLIPSRLHAEVAFNGLIALKDGTLFSLADSAAGIRSGWIGLQQEFAGFTPCCNTNPDFRVFCGFRGSTGSKSIRANLLNPRSKIPRIDVPPKN